MDIIHTYNLMEQPFGDEEFHNTINKLTEICEDLKREFEYIPDSMSISEYHALDEDFRDSISILNNICEVIVRKATTGKYRLDYQRYLKIVWNNTLAEAQKVTTINDVNVQWEITNIEPASKTVSKYGFITEENSHYFSDVVPFESIKLGRILIDKNSPLIDLEFFVGLLEKNGITSYIDYDNSIFHFNPSKNNLVKKRKP